MATTTAMHTTTAVSAFITNLRLLNIDLLEDWPEISPSIFAFKTARENQKQRIRCVEWALYRLFEKWNPKETRNKLQPFFPPYQSLRSINLRAALLRCLTDLKKDGILGKEIVIRKTMFDDCRGDKFEELLASFSNMVVQKVRRSGGDADKTVAGRLATGQNGSEKERRSMVPLAIAHKVSLKALLQRKALLRARYASLGEVLDAKERELLGRVDQLAQADQTWQPEIVPDQTMQALEKRFQDNWQGDAQWVDGVLKADRREAADSLLDIGFNSVWSRTEQGTINTAETLGEPSMVQDLTNRVRDQQQRLQHWQKVQQDLMNAKPKSPVKLRSPIKASGGRSPLRDDRYESPLKFGYHDASMQDGGPRTPQISPELKSKYHELLERSQRGPRNATAGKLGRLSPMKLSHSTKPSGSPSPVRKRPEFSLDESESSPAESFTLGVAISDDRRTTLEEKRHNRDNEESLEGSTDPSVDKKAQVASSPTSDTGSHSPCIQSDAVRPQSPQAILSPQDQPEQGSKDQDDPFKIGKPTRPPLTERTSTMENDRLAQGIIQSTSNADVSPLKSRELLLERTRKSMAFCRKDSLLPDSSPEPLSSKNHEAQQDQQDHESKLTRSSSLAERTRRSMSLLPNPSSKAARNSIYDRRQSRQYPRNQFETPKKRLDDVDKVTPPDVLFSPDADYASVFKSRPKIATSPELSPTLMETSQQIQSEGSGAIDPL
ncbi:MAG: hypothetical protein Q9174_002992 [Haloplaca sp. 1 TL-2023]